MPEIRDEWRARQAEGFEGASVIKQRFLERE